MATWTDVQKHLRGKYRLSADEPNLVAIDFETTQGRAQRILVSSFDALGKSWVLFRSRVCEESELDPVDALRRNAGFAVGFLALAEGHYEVVYTAQLGTLDINELEVPLDALTVTADELEKELTGRDRW